jgi:hypothetical protein
VCDPNVLGVDDSYIVLSFDIMSFDISNDVTSWIYLEEVQVLVTSVFDPVDIVQHSFDTGSDGWSFAGLIPPYDEPASLVGGGHLGMAPGGSYNCFSYWLSPDIEISDEQVYRAAFETSTSVSNPDDTMQFRLRVNQKGSWQAWDRVVTSSHGQAPSNKEWETYHVIFDPHITGSNDNIAVFAFDLMSFDPNDDAYTWIYLESFKLEEIILSP